MSMRRHEAKFHGKVRGGAGVEASYDPQLTKTEDKAMTPTSDHIYYDINISNSSTTQSIDAVYSANLTQPILNIPANYYAAIARFRVPTFTIPLFQFITNAYSVCLRYNSVDYFAYVPFINGSSLPNPNQDVFGYQIFIDMINSALLTAWTALITANPSAPGNAGSPPTLVLDPVSDLCSLIASQGSFTPDNGSGTTIYFNAPLFDYFNSFPNVFNGYGTTNGKDFSLIVKNNYNNFVPIGAAGSGGGSATFPLTNSWRLEQEASTLGYWSDFQSLAITTTQIPVQKEYLPQSSLIAAPEGTINYRPILTDFHPNENGPVDFSPIQYIPQQWRWVDLQGQSPLDKVDIQLWWVDYGDNFHLLKIAPEQSASLKILFRARDITD